MVVFACNSCGTSLKKNQVDKHVYQCRCSTVSCMDCQKDFGLKEYSEHIKCISEQEKYAGVGWKAPANFNKGEKKQLAWVDTVNETLKQAGNSLTPSCRSLLQAISKHDNVPRKKPKFLNFVSNISKNRFDATTVNNVWTLLDDQWKAQAAAQKAESGDVKSNAKNKENDSNSKDENEPSNDDNEGDQEQKLNKREKKEARKKNQHKEEKKSKNKKNSENEDVEKTNGHSENGVEIENGTNGNAKETKKERKKRKRLESATESEKKKTKEFDAETEETQIEDETQEKQGEDETETDRDFKWGAIIKEILLKQSDHEISMKKLRKKVFSEYYSVVGDSKGSKTQEELISKLNKKLKKQQFRVLKDSVRLVE